MKFGKQLETEINAAGVLGDRVPWIDYGCVPCVSRVDRQKDRSNAPFERESIAASRGASRPSPRPSLTSLCSPKSWKTES